MNTMIMTLPLNVDADRFRWAYYTCLVNKICKRNVTCIIYSYQTSFGKKKKDHFSLLCKQMDIYLRKVHIVRKVTFLA